MRHEIIIGTNKKEVQLPICHTCLWLCADISQSNISYCLHNKVIPITLYVIKDSSEGRCITEWIKNEENRNNESVGKKALELILPKLTIEELMTVLENVRNESYADGYKQAQANIRQALGLY